MDYEIDPNCPKCRGTGRMPFAEGSIHSIPCAPCVQRYHDNHCAVCDARLVPGAVWTATHVVSGRAGRVTRVCSNGCAVVVSARHGHIDIAAPGRIDDE